jgi:uncharacterized membrane protein YbaN (DUF454 family)
MDQVRPCFGPMSAGSALMSPESTGTAGVPLAIDRAASATDETFLDIEIDGRAGQVRVSDPRLFRPARRTYARRLLELLCDHAGVRRAEIELSTSTCRVDFDLASSSPAVMAEVFSNSVRAVSARPIGTQWWRRSPKWSSLIAYRSTGTVSIWETHAEEPGRLRHLRRGHVGDRSTCTRLADAVASLEGVERCQVSPWTHRITVVCGPDGGPASSRTLDRVERILEGQNGADFGAVEPPPGVFDAPEVATGWRRVSYMAMAGGAFTLTLVGLVVPGIPTAPFLLATSYYLARSSPRINERLRRTAFFGPMIDEWGGHAALSLSSKGKLIALTATIVVVTVVLAPLTYVALSTIVFVSSLSLIGIAGVSTLAADSRTDSAAGSRTLLPLPAH